jgi:DNA-binding IclR family transcriptional regulator
MPTTTSSRVVRDVEILRGVADMSDGEASGVGVVALAAALGRDKSQVSRALRALRAVGLVERDVTSGEYRLGLEVYALAARTARSRLLRVAPLVLRPLASELDETVHLCALHGRDVLTLRSHAPATHSFRASGWEGRVVPAHATSAGRVLVGDHGPHEIRRLFDDTDVRTRGCASQVQTVDDLIAVVDQARAAGYATVDGEFEHGVVGASAPVRDMRGDITAAINVSAEQGHLRDLQAAGRACALASSRLSELLGAPARRMTGARPVIS